MRPSLKAAAVGNWVFRVPLGYFFSQVFGLDLFWVWAVMHGSREPNCWRSRRAP